VGFTVTVEAEYLRIVLSGTLTPSDLEELIEVLLAHEATLTPVPHRVTDMSGLTRLDVGFPDIFQLAERARTRPLPNAVRSAIVAATPVQIGYARMFQMMNEHPSITVEIFDDLPAAVAWLTA
jgi:hypothetical protein